MSVRWCYIVEALDRATGIMVRERFLFPADAKHRAMQRREAGFCSVRIVERRVLAQGPASATTPGFYPAA